MSSEHAQILVIDDTPANLDLLGSILREYQYTVRQMPSGQLGLNSALANPPDLILLDIMMPEMDGYTVCKRLKEEAPTSDIPIIFISALTEPNEKVRAFEAGGVDYVTKPFERTEVLARVNTHLKLACATRELKQAKRAAESASRAKSSFLANMSHELRTPLNAMMGYAQILQGKTQKLPDIKHGIDVIYRSGGYLLSLINDILDLSKIEAGRFELFPTPFASGAFFREISAMFQIRAEQKGIGFYYSLSPSVPKVLIGDEKRLRQIIMNLLGNAVKFTERGEVKLECDYQDGALLIHVIDSGIGIPTDKLGQIFEPFSQAGEANYKVQGTGLGLAITTTLVKMMQGSISVESKLGSGSCFAITVPLPKAEQADIEDETKSLPTPIGYQRTDGGQTPLCLLVADDASDNRTMLTDLLTPLGFIVEAVSCGETILTRLDQKSFDLLITDLVMAGMDGLEVIQQVHAKTQSNKIPIIVLTGSAFTRDAKASLAAGAQVHIEKPLRQDILFKALKTYLPLHWCYTAETHHTTQAMAEPLPNEWVNNLALLIQQGRLSDLNELIDQYANDMPNHPLLSQLAEAAARFDVEALESTLHNIA